MKVLLSRILNYLLYLCFCAMTATGLALKFRLPCGRGCGRRIMMGLNRYQWADIHLWMSYTFIALIIIHLILHRQWLVKIAAKAGAWQLIAGLLAGLGLVAWLMLWPVG